MNAPARGGATEESAPRPGFFARSVVVLLSGSGLSTALLVATTPVISRLYTPAEFGNWALTLALAAIPITIACGKYELAIHLPERDEDALALLALALLSSLAVALACAGVIALAGPQLARAVGGGIPHEFLWVVPLLVFLSAAYAALDFWFKRKRRFRTVAAGGIATRALTAALQVGLGIRSAGSAGLIAGGIAGQAVTAGVYSFALVRRDRRLLPALSAAAIRGQARRYRDFPRYLVPSGLLEATSQQLPALLFSSLFGAGVLGLYSMAVRMVTLPLSLLGDSVRDVFWQSASREYARHGSCRRLFLSTAGRLAAIGAAPALLLLAAGPSLFGLVFGAEWREAGHYARLLGVMFWLRLLSSPLSCMFYIAERQRLDLAVQCCVFAGLGVAFAAAKALRLDAADAVLLYGVVYSLKYVAEFALAYRFSGGAG